MKLKKIVWSLILFSIASLNAMEGRSIQDIINKYRLTERNRCRMAANKETSSAGYEKNLEIACLIADLKDVYYMYSPEELTTMDPDLKPFLKEKNIQHIIVSYPTAPPLHGYMSNNGIMYTPQGEKNALLLAKSFLETALKGHQTGEMSSNRYLIGTLLGYSEEDKEFFYQLEGFEDRYSKFLNLSETGLSKVRYPEWPEEDKTAFTIYEKRVWPNSPEYQSFFENRFYANEWIGKNQKFTADQLKAQVAAYQKGLEKYKHTLKAPEVSPEILDDLRELKSALVSEGYIDIAKKVREELKKKPYTKQTVENALQKLQEISPNAETLYYGEKGQAAELLNPILEKLKLAKESIQ